MGCEKHGYNNPTFCPACDVEIIEARTAFVDGDCHQPTDKYQEWLTELDEEVIQGEFGYEPGEFTVYSTHWAPLFEEGLTPRAAWQRALDGYAQARDERDAEQKANYARIVAADEAAIVRERALTANKGTP